MKKKLSVLVLATFLFSGLGTAVVYADPPGHGPHWQGEHHDRHWHDDHDRQWRDHDRDWRDHDREWREHEGDRAWRERHAHEWHDWYRWHHDNGDEGFNDFAMGVIVGAILGNR